MNKYLIILLIPFLFACKSKEVVVTQEPLKERTQAFLTRNIEKNKFEFDWLGMKLDAEFTSGEEQQGFKATVRMRKDSAVSVSVSPALGIEVLRLLVDKDSLKMVSDIPGDKYVFLGSVNQLTELAKIDLDLSTLQDLLIGNPIGLSREEGRMKSGIEKLDVEYYTLVSRMSRRVRRASEDQDSLTNRDGRRVPKRLEDNDWISSKFWIESDLYKVVKCELTDIRTKRMVQINYSEFDEEDPSHYPHKCNIQIDDVKGKTALDFKIVRLNTQNHYDFSFDYDKDYPIKRK
ncbi:MAG: DUF4292 domain-containing protein [Flavobacteriales bacterium]|nr:DUF4292 domain-containing protein [Flavobacteriales bacterium]